MPATCRQLGDLLYLAKNVPHEGQGKSLPPQSLFPRARRHQPALPVSGKLPPRIPRSGQDSWFCLLKCPVCPKRQDAAGTSASERTAGKVARANLRAQGPGGQRRDARSRALSWVCTGQGAPAPVGPTSSPHQQPSSPGNSLITNRG